MSGGKLHQVAVEVGVAVAEEDDELGVLIGPIGGDSVELSSESCALSYFLTTIGTDHSGARVSSRD